MNGIIIVNKEAGLTSREVVEVIEKQLHVKAGHTGTLDPIAKGVLAVCVNKATKISRDLTSIDKEYEAKIILGLETDTLDITGRVLKEEKSIISKDQIEEALSKFKTTYNQEVPIYSAVKIKGKKLYEYARNNEEVELPKREVTIYDIKLINYEVKDNKTILKIYTKVSKGTYIRGLIRDIAHSLNTVGTMSGLTRTAQGKFKIEDAYTLEDIKNNKFNIISIKDALDIPVVEVDDDLKFKIIHAQKLNPDYEKVLFVDKDNNELAIYHKENNELRVWKMLYNHMEDSK